MILFLPLLDHLYPSTNFLTSPYVLLTITSYLRCLLGLHLNLHSNTNYGGSYAPLHNIID